MVAYPLRGRPKKSEGPRKKPLKAAAKLVSPPFADECPDPDSVMPKEYRGRNLRYDLGDRRPSI